ncbi:MAG: hypothetical protein P0Y59_03410 [Candidatus Sphingomonas phytovorans]|nr:hypothetical protein [Sphingomonas sp.]WEK00757.1 MAG: hypothetical protein P0Y59_03410 [Sphingomonas sp.]
MKPLEFYPSRKSIREAWQLGGFFALSAIGFGAVAATAFFQSPGRFDDTLVLIGMSLVSAPFAFGLLRSARRMSNGRRDHDPQLLVDRTGVVAFETFFWRRWRLEWKEIGAIEAVEDKKDGIVIVILDARGRARPTMEFRSDESGRVDVINAHFTEFSRRR